MNNDRFPVLNYIELYFIKLLSINPDDNKYVIQYKYNQSVLYFEILESKRQEFMAYYTENKYNCINSTNFMEFDNNFTIQPDDNFATIGLKFDKLINLIKIIFDIQYKLSIMII